MLTYKTKIGKTLQIIGFIIFICGMIFYGLEDVPEFLAARSLLFIIIGILMLLLSNFFTKKRRSGK